MEHRDCHTLLGSLSEYLDGETSEMVCGEIERHLAECENCRIVVDSLRKTIYLYHTTAEPLSVPEDVRYRLFCKLELDDLLEKQD